MSGDKYTDDIEAIAGVIFEAAAAALMVRSRGLALTVIVHTPLPAAGERWAHSMHTSLPTPSHARHLLSEIVNASLSQAMGGKSIAEAPGEAAQIAVNDVIATRGKPELVS